MNAGRSQTSVTKRLMRTRRLILLIVLLLAVLPVSVALAEALVVVRVHAADDRPVAGRVVLSQQGGAEHSCTVEAGGCRIDGVPGGRYVARFHPAEGPVWAPQTVMIPPEGTVELTINERTN